MYVCMYRVLIRTGKKIEKKTHAYDVNRRAAYAACEIGIGREGLATICEIMNLPPPSTEKSFQGHIKGIHSSIKVVRRKAQAGS